MRYGIFVILCILFAVANPAFGASKRCTTVFPLVAKMIPTNVCPDYASSVTALLRNDADCSSWRPTEQDALIVAAADRFVAFMASVYLEEAYQHRDGYLSKIPVELLERWREEYLEAIAIARKNASARGYDLTLPAGLPSCDACDVGKSGG